MTLEKNNRKCFLVTAIINAIKKNEIFDIFIDYGFVSTRAFFPKSFFPVDSNCFALCYFQNANIVAWNSMKQNQTIVKWTSYLTVQLFYAKQTTNASKEH